MTGSPHQRKKYKPIMFLAAAAALICFAVFLPSIHNGFAGGWDDDTNLTNNPYFRGLGWQQLRWMWTNHLMQHYVPLSWMTFGLDYTVWKLKPLGYHLTNLLLHSLNSALFCLLAWKILRLSSHGSSPSGAAVGATFAALLFGLHPLRVESVAWATERRDVLSGLFYLLTLLAYLQAHAKTSGPRSSRIYSAASFAFFTCSVLAKEIAVTLPLVLLILDVYPLRRMSGAPREWVRRSAWKVWIEKAPFFAVSLADSVMTTVVAFRHNLPETLHTLGWFPRLAITVYGMAFYILKTIVPANLSPLYPLTPYKVNPGVAPFLVSCAAVAGITYAAILFRRRYPGLLAVWIAYGVTLLPVGGLIHNGNQIVADRYTYLSCLGWAVLLGAAGMIAWQKVGHPAARCALAGVLLALAAPLAWQARNQIEYWRDPATLWTRAVTLEPSPVALSNLGTAMFQEGDVLGAVERYRQAIQMNPSYARAHANLGIALLNLHRPDDAIGEFQMAKNLAPGVADPYDGAGDAWLLKGKYDQAIANYEQALKLRPDYPNARENLRKAVQFRQARAGGD